MSEQTKSPATVEQPQAPARRWDPFSWFSDMDAEFDRFFGDRRFPMPSMRALRRGMHDLPVPKADIFEREGSIVVRAELPGVKKDDVSVEMEGNDLVIQGKRDEQSEVKEENYYRMERSSGSYYRRIPLPEGVKTDGVNATYRDGMLEVVVPRPEQSAPTPTKIDLQ
jgi:HSP20 family protein